MRLGPSLFLVEDGSHSEIMFCGTEGVLHLVFPDVYGEMVIVFCHGDGKERGCPAVSFQNPADLPFYFLFISDLAFELRMNSRLS